LLLRCFSKKALKGISFEDTKKETSNRRLKQENTTLPGTKDCMNLTQHKFQDYSCASARLSSNDIAELNYKKQIQKVLLGVGPRFETRSLGGIEIKLDEKCVKF
jgi:hypothetical protein